MVDLIHTLAYILKAKEEEKGRRGQKVGGGIKIAHKAKGGCVNCQTVIAEKKCMCTKWMDPHCIDYLYWKAVVLLFLVVSLLYFWWMSNHYTSYRHINSS